MRNTLIATSLFALATLAGGHACAQQIKPGLWEMNVTMPGKLPSGPAMAGAMEQMKGQMASMPPEQRKEMEKMLAEMAARKTEFTGNGVRTRECFTKENIANFDLLRQKGTESCTRNTSKIPNGMTMNMACTRPQMTINATVKYQNEKAYTFESTTTVNGPDGKPMTHKSTGTGNWLSSDCGAVKPLSAAQ